MDIVYLLGQGSAWQNNEIKHSLRSIERHLKNFDKVFIIGERPLWLNGEAIYIKHKDDMRYCKERRIMEKLLFACKLEQLSDKFIMFNDDYFLTGDIDAAGIPYYYSGMISARILKRKTLDIYAHSMVNTLCVLNIEGLPLKYFDIHYPIVYDKKLFPEVMDKYDWNIKNGYIIKSLYANTLQTEGELRKDCKVNKEGTVREIEDKVRGTDLFSTKTYLTPKFREFIMTLYPEKSRFEK